MVVGRLGGMTRVTAEAWLTGMRRLANSMARVVGLVWMPGVISGGLGRMEGRRKEWVSRGRVPSHADRKPNASNQEARKQGDLSHEA
jgi:hypothetical protein